MSCIYKYKDRVFDSEAALDDFLAEKYGYESEYGDLVFNRSANFLRSKNTIEGKIMRDAADMLLLMKIRNAKLRAAYIDGEEILDFPRPYVGVNRLLQKIEFRGKRLHPELIAENYWNKRKESWTTPLNAGESIAARFSEDEINIFFEGTPGRTYSSPTEEYNDKLAHAHLLNDKESQELQDLMTKKWEFQAAAGTAFHYVLQQYFSKDGDKLIGDSSKSEIFDRISKNIEKDLSELMGDSKFRQYKGTLYNDTIINQAIDYADGLKAQLRRKYGDECEFYPELSISRQLLNGVSGEPNQVLGIIDLLVVDKSGQVHYFDYKTSPKPFDRFDSAKRRAYWYQLAMYGKLLKKYKLDYRSSDISILPIQFLNLKLANASEAHVDPKKALFSYDGITYRPGYFESETRNKIFEVDSMGGEKILDILDDYLPEETVLDVTSEDMLQSIEDFDRKLFPDLVKYKAKSLDEVKDMLEKEGALKPKDINGKRVFIYQPKGVYSHEIVADSDYELIDKVLKYQEKTEKRPEQFATIVKRALKYGINNVTGDIGEYVRSIDAKSLPNSTSFATWFTSKLAAYCNGNWELAEVELLNKLGIIMLKNIKTNQIDIIRLSNSNLTYNPFEYKLNANGKRIRQKNSLLSYAFQSDSIELSNLKSLMLKAYRGNIEMMEILHALNSIKGLEDAVIGNIQVINPYQSTGIPASNEELLYSYKKLVRLAGLEGENNILNGKIKLATAFDLGINAFNEAMETSSYYEINPSDYNSAKSALDESIENGDKEKKIEAINNIISLLENAHQDLRKEGVTREGLLNKPYVRLYNELLQARRILDGIVFKQQVDDHDKWLQERTFKGIFYRGVSGTYTDNPGNMLSDTLNTVAKLVTQAYLNIRNKMGSRVAQIRNATEELKKHKNYTGVAQLVGNATNMYEHMTEVVDGDLRFTDLRSSKLDDVERKYLKLILEIINENRFGGKKSKKELEDMRDNHNVEYYRVPLCMATAESLDSLIGLDNGLKERLKRFNPLTALSEIRARVDGLFLEEDAAHYQDASSLFTMNNRFDRSERDPQYRVDAITKNGAGFFERNLEVLAFKHCYAYEASKELNKVFPVMKSAMAYLAYAGNSVNKEFEDDSKYFENYIKNSVKGLPILSNELMQEATAVSGKIKQVASFMALAFSPVQAVYQTIQGLWQGISLIIRNPDGKHAFTLKNMWDAAKIVYLDVVHYSDTPTKCLLINEWLGVNDMDMNIYAERMRTDLHNKYNFVNFAFKFASRPDFYNRMTIIIAKMKADGIWDALEVKDGQLVYDFKKDARFTAFSSGNTADPQYNNQRALYQAIAQQFITEGVSNPDGTPFLLSKDALHPTPLPYAWTNQEAESVKSLCDLIYGYYSHEKKALIHATFLGSLYMQMKTYWSGKKNLYLAPGGVRIRGNWELAKDENEQLLYYQTKEDGTIDFDAQLTTEQTNAPFYQWKGEFQEGIIVTLSNLFKGGLLSKEGLKEGWNDIMNNDDENIRRIRQANMKLLGLDLIFYFGIGMLFAGYFLNSWDNDLTKNAKESGRLKDALNATLAHITRVSMGQSAEDFGWWSAIGNPAVNWSPFSFTQGSNVVKRAWNTLFGDTSFYDGVTKSFAAGKQMKPLVDWLNPENF